MTLLLTSSCARPLTVVPVSTDPVNGMKLRYLALGDSYTIGESVEISQRWPVQLVTRLRQEGLSLADPEIIAKTGWTTDDLLEAINKADPVGPFNLVSLLIGVNNQYRGRSDDDYRRGFIALLEKSIEMAGTNPAKVVVLSIPDWGVTPFARGRDNAKIAVEIDSFNAIAKEETERAGSTFVDITPVSRRAAQELRLLAGDGLHPSDSMYAEWVALALEPARKALRH